MSQFVNTFGINWEELLFFAINFLIVMWVLKRYLYKPILTVLQQRQQEIEEQAKVSSDLDLQRKKLSAEIDNSLKASQSRADEIIKSAKDIAETIRKKTIAETQQQIELMQINLQKQIEQEKLLMYQELKKDLTSLIINVSSKVIGQNLKDGDQEALIQDTIDSLEKGNEQKQ